MTSIIKLQGYYQRADHTVQAYLSNRSILQGQDLKRATCILPVNIWNIESKLDNLHATLELISRSFKECLLFLYDTQQKYSFALFYDKCEDMFFDFCKDEGYRWVHKNANVIDASLTIPYKIARWHNWAKRDEYRYFYEQITSLYNHDEKYKASIDAAVKSILDEISNRGQSFDREKGIKLYTKYIIEECIMTCMWANEKLAFIINTWPEAPHIHMTRKKIIETSYPDAIHPLPIRFRKYNNKQDNDTSLLLRAA